MANQAIPPIPSKSGKSAQAKPGTPSENHSSRNIRETIESIVIAFVLAFLFRTFEAEAFVIPTGSMAPTLQGRHKDITCEKCGYRYQASASEEESQEVLERRGQLADPRLDARQREQLRREIDEFEITTATCPNCRWTTVVDQIDGNSPPPDDFESQPSFNGDRILVSKLSYQMDDPDRWDVVVFKYPGEGKQNYIKRLVGLPGETIRIQNGDIHVRNRQGGRGPRDLDTFTIERKPPHKVLALQQVVHDSDFDSAELHDAGWPLRWSVQDRGTAAPGQADGSFKLTLDTTNDGRNVQPTFNSDGTGEETWIRYEHVVPDSQDWERIEQGDKDAATAAVPRLISDFYAYNTEVTRHHARDYASPIDPKLGMNWVGDLLLECEVVVDEAQGSLVLELVEAGVHFQCVIDLTTGEATILIDDEPQATATTDMRGAGTYALRMANVDDQLIVWIDDTIIDFGGEDGTFEYDAREVFGDSPQIVPRSTAADPGDLAPIGIASRNAKLTVRHLKVMRDVYYIGDESRPIGGFDDPSMISEYNAEDPTYQAILRSIGDLFNRRGNRSFNADAADRACAAPTLTSCRIRISGTCSTIAGCRNSNLKSTPRTEMAISSSCSAITARPARTAGCGPRPARAASCGPVLAGPTSNAG